MLDLKSTGHPSQLVMAAQIQPLSTSRQILQKAIAQLRLKYVVISSVDCNDLRNDGVTHFADCITKIRELSPMTHIKIMVPEAHTRMDRVLTISNMATPDVMHHKFKTAPRLSKEASPSSDYEYSLHLLDRFKKKQPPPTYQANTITFAE